MRSEPEPRAKPSQRDRFRYVAFRIRSPRGLERSALIQAVREASAGEPAPWLTRFEQDVGVLRCLRGREAWTRRLINEAMRTQGVDAESLSTSGTLAGLERRHPDLPLGRGRQRRR